MVEIGRSNREDFNGQLTVLLDELAKAGFDQAEVDHLSFRLKWLSDSIDEALANNPDVVIVIG